MLELFLSGPMCCAQKVCFIPIFPSLPKRLAQGCRNANQLWKELAAQGFTGSYKLVNRWLAPRREKPGRKHSLSEKDLLGLTKAGRDRHVFPATRVCGHKRGTSTGCIGSATPPGLASAARPI